MRHFYSTAIRLAWVVFLVLSSVYCLLAYLPYTFHAFIKAPVYAWVPWFASHHVWLFWGLLLLQATSLLLNNAGRSRWLGVLIVALVGSVLIARPVLSQVRNDWSSYVYAVLALILLILLLLFSSERASDPEVAPGFIEVQYSTAAAVALSLAVLYCIGVQVRLRLGGTPLTVGRGIMLMLWSSIAHVTVALVLAAGLNLLNSLVSRFTRPRSTRFAILCTVAFIATWRLLYSFISSALSLGGWMGGFYTALLAVSITASVALLPLHKIKTTGISRMRALNPLLCSVIAIVALSAPALIGGNDWNGVIQRSVALSLWCLASICILRLRPGSSGGSISKALIVAVAVVLVFSSLRFSEIAWAKPLGSTDDEISRSVDAYAELDASFNTAHSILTRRNSEPCDDLCRILRQYSNIRTTPDVAGFQLVKDLKRSTGERPNIFIWVVDSLRPDYLGAYNPKATFTPNLDDFARESMVLRNAYTQYAGTTLSEPAIWTGSELLHTHYLHPFQNINSLTKLAQVDGYHLLVSRDTVLDELLPKGDSATDVEEHMARWNSLEMCSTTQALARRLDALPEGDQPVMFFSQPMNVHQFAINDLPKAKDDHQWSTPGFHTAASFKTHQMDRCFGQFVATLKKRNMYDNSIIVVTADHGDATGELGRQSHSVILYPEVMRVPLLIHLPRSMQGKFVQDDAAIKTLTDIAPTLYYLLGHREIGHNPLFGRPILAESQEKLNEYARSEWFMASDAIAAYGFLTDGGRYFYATYDSPARSYLYDLQSDPAGTKNVLTPELKREYDQRIIEHLKVVSDFYGYKPAMESFFSSK